MPKILILGAGYTGKLIACLEHGTCVLASRNPTDPSVRRFDLTDEMTWKNITGFEHVIWTFPPTPFTQVQKFFDAILRHHAKRIVVIGTTGVYLRPEGSEELPVIDETSVTDPTNERVQSEDFLRTQGATILRSAGIYGPGRNPIDWIRKGLVGDSDAVVNLIHGEDLAAACLAALEEKHVGKVFNVSDGNAYRWKDICAFAREHFGVEAQPDLISKRHKFNKKIDTAQFKTLLPILKHPDLFAELKTLQRSPS